MCKLRFLIPVIIGWCIILDMANGKIVTCNYNPAAIYLQGDYKFAPSDINATLCTYLRYGMTFKRTLSGEYTAVDTAFDFGNITKKGLISRTMDLKDINPKLKVIAGVSFRRENLEVYLEMAVNATKRKLFRNAALSFIQEHNFDGLDISWELNNKNARTFEDRTNFAKILRELNKAFKPFNYELSITVDVETNKERSLYHIPSIVKHVKYINIAAYGFFFRNKTHLTYDAPLFAQGNSNVAFVIEYWKKNGAPVSKLVLGLPFFGNKIELSDRNQFKLGAPINSKKNYYPYNEICDHEKKSYYGRNNYNFILDSWSYKFDTDSGSATLLSGNQMIVYDSLQTLKLKVTYGKCLNLAGYMIMNIEDNDFRGKCGKSYELLSAINNQLKYSNYFKAISYMGNTFNCNIANPV